MAQKTIGVGHLHGNPGTFTYTPEAGSTPAVINGVVKSFTPKGTYNMVKELRSQDAGIQVGRRYNDRTIEGSLTFNYLTSGTTVYIKKGGIITVSGMADTSLNVTFHVETDSTNYSSGEDIEGTCDVRWSEGITATA